MLNLFRTENDSVKYLKYVAKELKIPKDSYKYWLGSIQLHFNIKEYNEVEMAKAVENFFKDKSITKNIHFKNIEEALVYSKVYSKESGKSLFEVSQINEFIVSDFVASTYGFEKEVQSANMYYKSNKTSRGYGADSSKRLKFSKIEEALQYLEDCYTIEFSGNMKYFEVFMDSVINIYGHRHEQEYGETIVLQAANMLHANGYGKKHSDLLHKYFTAISNEDKYLENLSLAPKNSVKEAEEVFTSNKRSLINELIENLKQDNAKDILEKSDLTPLLLKF